MSNDVMTDLLVGVAELLAVDGVGIWSPGAPAGGGSVPLIVLRVVPTQPERVLTLTEYGLGSDAKLTDTTIGLNIRIRGDRNPASTTEMAGAVYASLHALGRRSLGTAPNAVLITDVTWQSEALIGPDQNQRAIRSVNYYVRFNRPHARLE